MNLPRINSAIKIPTKVCTEQRIIPKMFLGVISPYPKVDIVTRLKYKEPLKAFKVIPLVLNEQKKFL